MNGEKIQSESPSIFVGRRNLLRTNIDEFQSGCFGRGENEQKILLFKQKIPQ